MSKCKHKNATEVGQTHKDHGHIIVKWCPECGALKRTMTNWQYTDYPWQSPKKIEKKSEGEQMPV